MTPHHEEQRSINNLADEIFFHILVRIQGDENRFNAVAIRQPRTDLDLDTAREAAERAADVALQARRIISARVARFRPPPLIPSGTPPAPLAPEAHAAASTEIPWADEAGFPKTPPKPDIEAP